MQVAIGPMAPRTREKPMLVSARLGFIGSSGCGCGAGHSGRRRKCDAGEGGRKTNGPNALFDGDRVNTTQRHWRSRNFWELGGKNYHQPTKDRCCLPTFPANWRNFSSYLIGRRWSPLKEKRTLELPGGVKIVRIVVRNALIASSHEFGTSDGSRPFCLGRHSTWWWASVGYSRA